MVLGSEGLNCSSASSALQSARPGHLALPRAGFAPHAAGSGFAFTGRSFRKDRSTARAAPRRERSALPRVKSSALQGLFLVPLFPRLSLVLGDHVPLSSLETLLFIQSADEMPSALQIFGKTSLKKKEKKRKLNPGS